MNDFAGVVSRSAFEEHLPFIVPFSSVAAGNDGTKEAGHLRRCGTEASNNPAAAAATTVVPPDPAAAAVAFNEDRGQQAVDFHDLKSDSEQASERVGAPRTVSVSCCLCPARLEVSFMGYGDLVRRVEAAGWRYVPGRHFDDRAWCTQCRHDAGSAAG